MKRLTLAIGFLITAAGLLLVLQPSALVWLAHHSVTRLELYASASVRAAIGLLFLVVSSHSRAPRVLRLFGIIALVAGAATPLIGVDGAQRVADWWSHQALGLVRVFGLLALGIGASIVYACTPVRRAA